MISKVIAVLLFSLTLPSFSESSERHQIREPLLDFSNAQTILLKATNRSALGQFTDTRHIHKIFSKRMEKLGYSIQTDGTQDYDVIVQLDCEDQSTKVGQTINRANQNSLKTLNHNPPCILHYQHEGRTIPWQRIDRMIYAEGIKIAKSLTLTHQEHSASSRILEYLEQYDFPLLLAAEWNHVDRLIQTFHAPETTHNRQRFIITLLGEIRAAQAFSFLVKTLKEQHLIVATVHVLGNFGEQARQHLIDLLQTSPRSEVQAAAAYGLGKVGALTGDTRSTPLLLKFLTTPGMDIKIQTEIVWALGKAPDFAAFQPLEILEQQIWRTSSKDPGLQKLREAVNWSIREVRQGGHTDDY